MNLRLSFIVPCLTFLVVLTVAMAPYILFGTEAPLLIHDHLDAVPAWARVMAAEDKILAQGSEVVESILGGVERRFFLAPTKLYLWFFAALPPFWAIVAAEALTRAVGFCGVFLLLREIAGPRSRADSTSFILTSAGAAWFALLPFSPAGGGAVSAVPLIFWAALRVRRYSLTGIAKVWIILAVLLYVSYASFVGSGFFALCLLSGVIVLDLIRRQWMKALRLTLFNAVVTVMFLAQNLFMLRNIASSKPTSRDEFEFPTIAPEDFWYTVYKNFTQGQYHADPDLAEPLLSLIVSACVISVVSFAFARPFLKTIRPQVLILWATLVTLLLTALAYGAFKLSAVQGMIESLGIPAINFGRFHYMQPALWAIAFGCALIILVETLRACGAVAGPRRGLRALTKAGSVLVALLVLAQIYHTFDRLHAYQAPSSKRHASFATFYDPVLFQQIASDLEGSAVMPRLGVIGLHPAIPQMNDLATVGGYLAIYPLSTKHAFRRIIAAELEKSPRLTHYFDKWGSRAYLFSVDLDGCRLVCWAGTAPDSIDIALDMEAFKTFGGTHLLSASQIANAGALNLDYIRPYVSSQTETKHWSLHLYRAR